MKVIVFILSFIVVVLSTVPCYAYHNDAEDQIEKQCDEHSRKCSDDCIGNCSPFYSCGTCIGFVSTISMSFTISKILAHTNTSTQPNSYENPIHSAFFCKIWQPPKIA